MTSKINQNFIYKKNILQQVRGFYYAVRYNSVSQAAKMMNLTQSTVTLQIQSLERDLGFKLFKRDSKPLLLTKEGEEFYRLACPLIHEFESVVTKFLDHKKQSDKIKIDIAMHHIAISYLMPKIVAVLKRKSPNVEIIIRNISPTEAVRRLKNDEIDLAFYPNVSEEPELMNTEVISYDPVLIMNKNHPLAKKQIKSLKDLSKFDLIRIDRSLITLPFFEEAVRIHQIKGSIEFENGNWEMLKHFVKVNNFAAVVSTICLDEKDDDLIAKNLANFFPKMSYSIVAKKGQLLKPVLQNVINAIREIAKDYK